MADKHIKLIVTGDSEKKSLHTSLKKCFPLRTVQGDLVVWDTPRKAHGVTGYRFNANSPPSSSMTALVDVMFVELLTSKTHNGVTPDLVIVIDDVELGNLGQEGIVVKAFQEAVKAKLDSLRANHSAVNLQRIQLRVHACCSFHLLCPMVESYFFADPATLAVGGVPLTVSPSLVHPSNVEKFDATPDENPNWQTLYRAENARKQLKDTWWRTECHPKRYLTHLLSISNVAEYQETVLGAKMIEATNWAAVAKSETDSPIVSAFLEDIWDWFGIPPTFGQFLGQSSTATYRVRTTPPNQRLLRNI